MGPFRIFRVSVHGLFFLQRDFKKSTRADFSLKLYPQCGQHRRLQFLEKGHPVHFTSFSENSFPQSGHLYVTGLVISHPQKCHQIIQHPADTESDWKDDSRNP
jgi:hypothetical protein